MAKFKPGIPEGFSLDVEPVRDLGDYLDEPSPLPQRRSRTQSPEGGEGSEAPLIRKPTQAEPLVDRTPVARPALETLEQAPVVEPSPIPQRDHHSTLQVPLGETPAIVHRVDRVTPQVSPAAAPREPVVNEDRLPKPKGPRREVSMKPETLRMTDALLEVIRSGSGQRDTYPNELVDALVLLVYEVIDEIDTHAIPKRGRWGTPTARAYPLELKNAFLQALLRKYASEPQALSNPNYAASRAG